VAAWIGEHSIPPGDSPTTFRYAGVGFGKIDDVVLVGEGIETLLSLKSILPDLPSQRFPPVIWRGGNFRPVPRRLIVACDH
jgi:hypothetical protein